MGEGDDVMIIYGNVISLFMAMALEGSDTFLRTHAVVCRAGKRCHMLVRNIARISINNFKTY